MRIIKSATKTPLSPIPKRRAIAAVPLSPNTLTSPLPSNRQLTTSHPSPKNRHVARTTSYAAKYVRTEPEKLKRAV
jgi:hypothetical protein